MLQRRFEHGLANDVQVEGDTARIVVRRKDGSSVAVLIDASAVDRLRAEVAHVGIECRKGGLDYAYVRPRFLPHRVRIHHWLIGRVKGTVVDHKNGQTLDNRGDNLRPVTNQINAHNNTRKRKNKTGYRGVSLASAKNLKNPYNAYLVIDGKRNFLGSYSDPKTAALAVYGALLTVDEVSAQNYLKVHNMDAQQGAEQQ